jgi:hypothetical protein
MDGEMLEQNLKCPICLTIAEDPWESSCCGHLFCNRCIKLIKSKKCPICRTKKANFRENSFAKILLNNIMVKCPYGCELTTPLAILKLHRYQCELSVFKCSMRINNLNCNFEGNKKASLEHFKEKHSDYIMLLAEHYPSVKNTYDKCTIIEKYNKNKLKERETIKNYANKEWNMNDLLNDDYLNTPVKSYKDNLINFPINSENKFIYRVPSLNIREIIKNNNEIDNHLKNANSNKEG